MTARSVTLVAALVTAGLSAGLFYGWSVSVIRGHARVGDRHYISSMQEINRAILNPFFFVVFFGAGAALVASCVVHFADDATTRGWWLAAASATYLVGVLGVTVGGNVPLNNRLEAFDLGAADDDLAGSERRFYEHHWNRWHAVRTAAATIALALASIAAVVTDGGI